MSDYVTLMGAEQVQSAARQISQAADNMLRAANMIDQAVHRLSQILEEDRAARESKP
jgi:hypothetical protein